MNQYSIKIEYVIYSELMSKLKVQIYIIKVKESVNEISPSQRQGVFLHHLN